MTRISRTQVAIIGAGPAGLLLSHLLHLRGIESIVLEVRSRQEVEATVRAGVLEQGTVDLLCEVGVGQRLRREGLVHQGIILRFAEESHRIDLHGLTGGRAITIYPQHEVLRDLIQAAMAAERQVVFSAQDVRLHHFETEPWVTFTAAEEANELHCDFIAGCDGFHGVCRPSIPTEAIQCHQSQLQIGWLGILVESPPSSPELIYARHDRGFALVSTRSPQVQRLYLQCDAQDRVELWPDERIWSELRARLATRESWQLNEGRIFQKCVVPMRSFVAEPMQYGRLYLAGDAAHIVPPTGAKGLNLAVADTSVLATALSDYYECGQTDLLNHYSRACLPRVWRAQRFSAWMTSALHRLPNMDAYRSHLQLAELEHVVSSRAAATSLAENYAGFPLPRVERKSVCRPHRPSDFLDPISTFT